MSTDLTDKYVQTQYGTEKFLVWLKNYEYRNNASFDVQKQLELAKKIAAVDDKRSRDMLLSLLSDATYLQTVCTELKAEMATVHKILNLKPPENAGGFTAPKVDSPPLSPEGLPYPKTTI